MKYDASSLRERIDQEGGVIEALEYGIPHEDILDARLADQWRILSGVWDKVFIPAIARFEASIAELSE